MSFSYVAFDDDGDEMLHDFDDICPVVGDLASVVHGVVDVDPGGEDVIFDATALE
jgi:hypothetical protein